MRIFIHFSLNNIQILLFFERMEWLLYFRFFLSFHRILK